MIRGVREVALATLLDRRPGFVEDHLSTRLASSGLAARDRALATEIVLGTVRRRGTLDAVLAAYSSRPIAKIDPVVLHGLRMGLYQVVFLDRVPPHAAVGETVEAVKESGRRNSAGFVNGILRSIVRDRRFPEGAVASPRRLVAGAPRPVELGRDVFPDPGSDPAGHLAAVHSHPRWLVERWLARFGRERTIAVLEAGNAPASATVFPLSGTRDDLAAGLVAAGYEVEPAGETHLRVAGGPVEAMPGFREGRFLVQDPTQADVVAGLATGGARILDVCAAPGTKSALMARAEPSCWIVAVDSGRERMARVRENQRRLGIENVRAVVADARALPFPAGVLFDSVLVDAPCSNTGVLARRVEARWRLDPDAIRGLASLQSEILSASADRVVPGGRLVYSTCTIEAEENEDVVSALISARPDLRRVAGELRLPQTSVGGGFRAVFERIRSC